MIHRMHRTTTGVRMAALAALALLLAGTGSAAAYPLHNLPDALVPEAEQAMAGGSAQAFGADLGADAALPGTLTAEGSEVAPGIHRYIVLLTDPPVAEYRGGIGGLAPTAADVGAADESGVQTDIHLDPTTLAAESYIRFLERSQSIAINRIRRVAPELKVGWRYHLASNGFSADMTPAHALLAMKLPGIRVVYPQEALEPEMDGTAQLLGTNLAWESAGGTAEAGLGVRLGILDSGTDAKHPFFNDEGMPPAPEGFPAATLHGMDGTVLNYPNVDEMTNNKVIATRVFAMDVTSGSLGVYTPWANLNSDHGLHVGGTAGGRHGTYDVTIGGSNIKVAMGGMAPMAQVLYYVNNWASTPGMLAAYDEMLKDKVDVVNISLGHSGWLLDGPQNHPIAIAQRAAAAAGLLSVASAGNAGSNGRTSLSAAWKYSDEILVVGNTTTIGTFNIDGTVAGTALPPELQSLSFGPYSSAMPATDLEADLYFVATGNGCAQDPNASGKIAVIEYATEAGTLIGNCNQAVRATNMMNSGAVGMVLVYYTYYSGNTVNAAVALPTVTIGYSGGTPLVDWLKTGGAGKLTLKAGVRRGYDDKPDILSASSSRGPGVDWGLKPDISAPGTFIFSSRSSSITSQGQVVGVNRTFGLMSGTSMSTPHVTGAAALIRSVHPTWSVAKLKSALINTSVPQVVTGPFASLQPATATDGGPGRLDMRHVLDPGAFLYPQKLSFGAMPEGVADEIPVIMESASDKAETWTVEVEVGGGDGEPLVDPEEFTLAPGEKQEFFVEFDSADLAASEHWGHLVFRRAGTEQVLRQSYYAFVDQVDNRDDVLLINWTYGETPNYAPYYTKALDELGLSYTVWNMGDTADNLVDRKTTHPPFSEMFRHDLVILNGNMSPRSLMEFLGAKFQYQNHLLGGGNMLIAGQGTQGFWTYLGTARYADTPGNRAGLPDTFPRSWAAPASQNVGCEMCLARYFAGYTPVLTATLSGKLLVPFPMKPSEPEMDVVLAPHPEADGPFSYPLDISTGAKAPSGAAGNQYRLNAGRVLDGYLAPLSAQRTRDLGDISYAETAMAKTIPLARPLWSFGVKNADGEDETLAVGTYVAGRQHSEVTPPVAWNAMYWGFGLEGVGAGAPGSVSQARLLGDTFNFLARNLAITASNAGTVPDGPSPVIRVTPLELGADEVLIVGTEVDWGDGSPVVKESFAAKPIPAQQFFTYTYAQSGTYRVTIKLIPEADQDASSAPVFASLEVTAKVAPKGIYLPLLLSNDESLSPPTATTVPAELTPVRPVETPPAILRRED
jgi:subtilisin family serine protease